MSSCITNPTFWEDSRFDPDIAGPGVVASVLVLVVITFLSILVTWLATPLTEDYFNEIDQAFMEWLRSKYRKRVRSADPPSRRKSGSKKLVAERFERFVLALSDQQLVTGFAILITIWIKFNDLSCQMLTVGHSLSWLSTITHLATLTMLRKFFDAHTLVRTWRVIAMATMALLATATFLYIHILTNFSDRDPGNIVLSSLLLVLLLLLVISAYTTRLLDLYVPSYRTSEYSWPIWLLHSTLQTFVQNEFPSLNEFSDVMKANLCRKMMEAFLNNEFPRTSRWWISYQMRCYAFQKLSQSFLWKLNWIFFFNCFGITYFGYNWGNLLMEHGDISSASWSFGQIVPLLLLFVPLLNAVEVYNEYTSTTTVATDQLIEEHVIETSLDVGVGAISSPTPKPQAFSVSLESDHMAGQLGEYTVDRCLAIFQTNLTNHQEGRQKLDPYLLWFDIDYSGARRFQIYYAIFSTFCIQGSGAIAGFALANNAMFGGSNVSVMLAGPTLCVTAIVVCLYKSLEVSMAFKFIQYAFRRNNNFS